MLGKVNTNLNSLSLILLYGLTVKAQYFQQIKLFVKKVRIP